MKFLRILIMGGVMVCPPVALADSSFDAAKLGYMKGVLDSCGSVSPQDASEYLLQMKSYLGNATRDSVSKAMHTDEYQQAYQSIRDKLKDETSNMTRDQKAAACTSYLTSN